MKALGGHSAAMDDEPTSIWMNPAGLAFLETQIAVDLRTFSHFEEDLPAGAPRGGLAGPLPLPSFLGIAYQIGSPMERMAIGFAVIQPTNLRLTWDFDEPSNQLMDSETRQSLYRIRTAIAYDWRFTPSGRPGFLTHIAAGLAVDLGFSQWEETFTRDLSGPEVKEEDTATGLGFGFGLLAGVYQCEDGRGLSFGVSYQSSIDLDFGLDPMSLPIVNMPTHLAVGFSARLLDAGRLRMTLDAQLVDWEEATQAADPTINRLSFRSTRNLGVGAEYRLHLQEDGGRILIPRIGIRLVERPWEDPEDLPAIGRYKLLVDTESDSAVLIAIGCGYAWLDGQDRRRRIDLGIEMEPDALTLAIGTSWEI